MNEQTPQQPYPVEPIAIIGMGCRFPGAANPEQFWHLLRSGADIVGEIPPERWDIAAYYDPDPSAAGKMYVRKGYFLADIDQFDPQFFNLSPREAAAMDPQQRLALEVSWETLENANVPPAALAGSRTGIFISTFWDDYSAQRLYAVDPTTIDRYSIMSNQRAMIGGRLAHFLGVHGPNLLIDTACSSSLTALHLACQSLRSGECDLALVGGVYLLLTPEVTIGLCRMGAISADGRSKAFDRTADGFGQGEGCGMVLLKRLTAAQTDGDTILALIRGSAINHGGRSLNVTTPNAQAQQMVLSTALANAGVSPQQIQYVEAHGTGTPLGDPIEAATIGQTFGALRQTPLAIGSVKSNIGHLNTAAGIAGLIKVVLAMQHGEIPPTLHCQQPTPMVRWQKLGITVPTVLTPWLANGAPRLAGVSAFGLSGSNAHVILEEAPKVPVAETTAAAPQSPMARTHHLLTLSGATPDALQAQARQYSAYLRQQTAASLADICHTAATGRQHFAHRLAVVATTNEQAAQQLTTLTQRQEQAAGGTITGKRTAKLAFLFTGQGAQYVGMGRELYTTSPTFRATLDRCDELLREHMGESLLSVLYPEWEAADRRPQTAGGIETTVWREQPQSQHLARSGQAWQEPTDPINATTYTQPALFVLEYALATLWQSWGIQPDILMGHSIGELAAACVAGVFSLEDGLKLVAARGRLMGALPQDGEMVSLLAAEARVRRAIAPYHNVVSLAAVNGPESIVIAGKRQVVRTIADQLAAEGVKTRQLRVSHAFHSPLMEPMLDAFQRVAQSIRYQKPKLPLVSNLTGEVAGDEIATPEYWVRHVRETVRFADGIQTLHQQGIGILLEIGPKPLLLGMAEEQIRHDLPATVCSYVASLHRNRSDWQQMLTSLGVLYTQGIEIDWRSFDADYQQRRQVLPTYPFQRKRYWIDAEKVQQKIVQSEKLMANLIASPTSIVSPPLEKEQPLATPLLQHATSDTIDLPALLAQLQRVVQQGSLEIDLQISEIRGLHLRIAPSHQEKIAREPTPPTVPSGKEVEPSVAPQIPPREPTPSAEKRLLMPLPIAQTRRIESAVVQQDVQPNHTNGFSASQPSAATVALTAPATIALPQIVTTLKQLLADLLCFEDVNQVNEVVKFIDLGLDSVGGVEYINLINRAFDLQLKAMLLYDHSSINELAAYIFSLLPQKITTGAVGSSQPMSTKPVQPETGNAGAEQTALRALLTKVAKGELTPKAGSKDLEKFTIAAHEPAVQSPSGLIIDKAHVWQLLQGYMTEILPAVAGKVQHTHTFDDLGFDSVEQAEIIVKTLEALQINAPRIAFAQAKTVGEVAAQIARHTPLLKV